MKIAEVKIMKSNRGIFLKDKVVLPCLKTISYSKLSGKYISYFMGIRSGSSINIVIHPETQKGDKNKIHTVLVPVAGYRQYAFDIMITFSTRHPTIVIIFTLC